MKSFNKTISRKTFSKWYIIVIAILYGLAILSLIISNGESWNYLIWHGDTIGIFPDLCETVTQADNLLPYDSNMPALYPPFAYVMMWPLALLLPGDTSMLDSYSPVESTVYFSFFAIIFVLFYIFIDSYFVSNKTIKILFFGGFVFSAPFLYCLERGNIVVVSVLLCSYYVMNYDSENKIKKELAMIALACAASLKIYPVFFGLLLISEKKYKDALRCILYGLIVFIIPFFIVKNDFATIWNNMYIGIKIYSIAIAEKLVNWGFSYWIGIPAIVYSIGQYNGVDNELLKMLILSITILSLIFLVLAVFFLKNKAKKVLAIVLILTFVPGFSWIYNSLYFFPVIILMNHMYLKEERICIKDIINIVIISLLFVPLPYCSLFETLYGDQKISLNTFITNAVLTVIVLGLICETVMAARQYLNAKLSNA